MFRQLVRDQHPSESVHSWSMASGTTANPDLESQVSEKPTLNDVIRMQMTLHYDNVELKKNIMTLYYDNVELKKNNKMLQDEIKIVRELLESRLDIQDGPDNYDMAPDQIKELILEQVQVGEPFYASDIASKYGLDYDAVVTAIEQLRAKGKINDDV